MAKPLRILVISDTHNHLPPKLDELAAGVDEIWHLGDVCDPGLLEQVRGLGLPLTIVRGNCDDEMRWPLHIDLKRNGVRFRLIHIPPNRVPADVDVVIHGHTHVPRYERVGDVLFLNPGCVTRPNRGAAASVAYLDIAADGTLKSALKTTR
ncbi:MAG: metallophosphoesterase family protein [Chthoniobacterales bacterium]